MIRRFFVFTLLLGFASSATAADWIHWRGPEQNGMSRVTGLPDSFGITEPGKKNLLWKSSTGGRSTPLIMNGLLYLITADGEGLTEGERVVCMNADTGAMVWEQKFRVFHTDIVSSRLGWTSLTADPSSGTVFCHGTQGHVYCFEGKTGAIKWHHNLTEEYGRITGYGGRIVSPIFDSGLVIVGMVNGSWGNQAIARNRFIALDGKTGEVAWWADTPNAIKGTYYSNPVVAVIKGQRVMVTGGADGYIHGFKVRTGERLWSHRFSEGVINPSPIVEGNLVYISHGEENVGGGVLGKVICLDASVIDPKAKTPKVVWETKRITLENGSTRQNIRFGLASPALADGILYLADDSAELYAFDAKTGKGLWSYKYGIVSRGAPLVADGKLYVFDVNGQFRVLKLKGKAEPEELEVVTFKPKAGVGFLETHGTPIAVNGRLYFCTREDTYCIDGGKPSATEYKPLAAETPVGEAAGLRIFPAEVLAAAGGELKFKAIFVDVNGREVTAPSGAEVTWELATPPLPPTAPKGATPPPALRAKLTANGAEASVALEKMPTQQGYVSAKAGKFTAPLARVRVAAQIPYKMDFEMAPEGVVPGGWVNAQAKYVIKKLPDGNKVLSKVNNDSRPPFARASSYMTGSTVSNYTIQSDLMGTEVRGKLPDMGLVNSRYTLVMDGKPDPEYGNKPTIRLVSWEARPRINHAVAFDWKPGVWYTMKFTTVAKGTGATIQGKIWEKGKPEPTDWTITFDDPAPNLEGAAAVYGYVTNMREGEKPTADGSTEKVTEPGSEIYYDNIVITPNKK